MFRKVTGSAATTLIVVAALTLAGWFVFSAVTGASLITFRTGSMAPTMPQGALAITLPVTASELEVGDVITVRRSGEKLPVTHRILEIGPVQERAENAADIRAAAPESGPPDLSSTDARQIVMQGDANKTPDSLPYALTDARRVIVAVPGLGSTLMLLQSPFGIGIMLLFTGSLTVWAFWPESAPRQPVIKTAPRHAAPRRAWR